MFSSNILRPALALALGGVLARGQGPPNVLVVVNDNSSLSRSITDYYVQKRAIPLKNVCHIRTSAEEGISRENYDREVAGGVAKCIRQGNLMEQILYIATTAGVPLRVDGSDGPEGDVAAVDSELAMLYWDLKTGKPHVAKGLLANPFFKKVDATFSHAQFPIYTATRLAAYDFPGVRAMIDRSLQAANRGKFVIDLKEDDSAMGNDWLRDAAVRLPATRVIYDTSTKVLYKQNGVIGYAGWGSNDFNRHERHLGFQWLPGAIATEFVSTNGRTFARPPKDWNISDWGVLSRLKWFAGSPQTMTADYLDEGASAATGHVAEPYLTATPRPDYLFPAYFKGRNLAESYYLSLPYLSWQNIMAGDPLMSQVIGKLNIDLAPFHPFFKNPHLATIAGNFWKRPESELRWPVETVTYLTEPEVQIQVQMQVPAGTPRAEVILVHGLEGSSQSGYMRSMAHAALGAGFTVHRFNMRGCGGTEALSVLSYHAGQTSDLLAVLKERRRLTDLPIFIAGYSLGANVVLKLAGELGTDAPGLLTGVASVSAPIDLNACAHAIGQRRNYLYQNRFLDRLKDRIRRKNALLPDVYSLEHLPRVKSIVDFDDHYTARLFGFGTAENYFRTQSANQFLEQIRVPALLITAKDDPMVPFRVYEHPAFAGNPMLKLCAVEQGGHLGFISRNSPRFWLDHTILDWMEQHLA